MPPIVSIIGKSNSGKTTLIEKLIGELKSRGYRVATIKHTRQKLALDQPGKDSWRHLQAGSEATIISGAENLMLIKPTAPEASLEEIARTLGEDYDIILTEGFRQDDAPKIEAHLHQSGPPYADVKKLIAVVTDEPLPGKARQFPLDDIKGLSDLLEQGFIRPQSERVLFYVNNVAITLSTFPREIIGNVITAIASSLKGVGDVESVQIFLKRKPSPNHPPR